MLAKPFLFCLFSSAFIGLCSIAMFFLNGPTMSLMLLSFAIASMAVFSRFYSKGPVPVPISIAEPRNTTNYSRK